MLIRPKPLPRTTLDGRPKFTMLKTLKNSARNSTVPNSLLAAVSERSVFDQGYVEIVEAGAAEGAAAQRSESAVVRAGAIGKVDGNVEERALLSPRPK